jgi:predicted transcriptional regulator
MGQTEEQNPYCGRESMTPKIENLQIVRLAEGDVRCGTDHLADFRSLLLQNEALYPSIGTWIKSKVLPGIRHNERVAFVGYLDGIAAVSAVVKKGNDAKFCHLRIGTDLQDSHLGELFFMMMALEVRDLAKTIYFTLPEALWRQKSSFFTSFSFATPQVCETQYRLFDREFRCSATFSDVWQSIAIKLPKLADYYSYGEFAADNQLIFSVKPRFAQKILDQKKTVEIRRRFSNRWLGQTINLYASAPLMSLVGEARIAGITKNTPEAIWQKYHNQIGCSRREFDMYAGDAMELFAIELDHAESYRKSVPIAQLSDVMHQHLRAPQSYYTLERNKPWARAVSIAAYLGGSFKTTISFAKRIVPFRNATEPHVRLSQSQFQIQSSNIRR